MNNEMKVGLLVGFLEGIINGWNYTATVDVKKVREFLDEMKK